MRDRRGFTLLEALLAVGIFAASMAAIVQLMRGSARTALRANGEVMAAARCESMMEELVGPLGLAQATATAHRWSDDSWLAKVRVDPSSWPGLVQVTVETELRAAPELGRFELVRLLLQSPNNILPLSSRRFESERAASLDVLVASPVRDSSDRQESP